MAQASKVAGKVTDASGTPLIGVSVTVKDTVKGTATDVDGNYALDAQKTDVLVFEFLGYKTQEITVGSQTVINVSLVEDMTAIDQVVVVGYGTMEKKMVTSSVSSVSGDALMPGAGNVSVANALRGKVGSLVISGTDSANAGQSLQLRGSASINGGTGPLVVIDGMPGGDIRSVLPEDIKSIDVLKDASAGAIYGSRAAGGVILITTKNASGLDEGTVRLSYTGEFSHKDVLKRPDVLNAEEFLEYRALQGAVDYGDNFNWYEEMLNKNNFSQKHTVNLQANSKKASIYATFQYNDLQGVAMEDERQDIAGRVNANFKAVEGWLDIAVKADYRRAVRNNNNPNFAQAIRNNPTRGAYDDKSNTGYNIWLYEDLQYNTIAAVKLYDYWGLDQWFKPEVSAKLNILPVQGLSYTQTMGYELRQWENHTYRWSTHQDEVSVNRKGTAYQGFSKTENINSEGYFNYINSFDKHNINATLGYSYYEYNNEGFNMTNYDFPVEATAVWDIGTGMYNKLGQASMSSSKAITQKLMSYFARVNYDYDGKYIVSASFRRESSSKFAKNNRWGNFWSVSAGWRISDEPWMENVSWIDDLKLRAAYGVTGNSDFSASYASMSYGSDGYFMMPASGNYAIAYGPAVTLNPSLKWEEQRGWNFGLDFSLFDNRLYGKFDWYNRKVVDMLFSVSVPQPPYALTSRMENIGSLRNMGWEFEIGADIVRNKDWNYSTNFIFSHDRTEVLNLYGNGTFIDNAGFPSPGTPGNAHRLQEGRVFGEFYMRECVGIDKETGDFLIKHDTGDGKWEAIQGQKSSTDDRRTVGNYVPKVMASWNNRVSYKNWDFSMDIRSWIDFDVFNTLEMYFGLQKENDINLLKVAYTKNKDITQEKQLCSYWLQDGTFLKIDAINLGYTLPLKDKTNGLIQSLRIYGNINNVCTITGYEGMDPEVNVIGHSAGIEWWNSGFYPRARTYTLGVQLTF
ncbi:MAG: SusC/RagA family TonB-linked outer membrane protein [Rikenellaceae bacterium]|nr:SusC/RagA family TonB-linked outer membrane protein [Rikenellaceae bacterium]